MWPIYVMPFSMIGCFLVGIHIDNIGFGFKRHNHPIHDVSLPPDGYNEMEDDDCQPVVSY